MAQLGTALLSWPAFQWANDLPGLPPLFAGRGLFAHSIHTVSCMLLPAAVYIGMTFPLRGSVARQ